MAGKPVVMRQAVNDTRGHVSELLMPRAVNQGALDADMGPGDKDQDALVPAAVWCRSMTQASTTAATGPGYSEP